MENLNITQGKATILMVNIRPDKMDDHLNRFVSKYDVLYAFNEEEAIWFLERESITAIIINACLSVDSGFQLCKKVKFSRVHCHIPVVLLLAENSLQIKIQGFECGADAYVEKPVSASYLHAQVKVLLKNRNRMREYFQIKNPVPSSSIKKYVKANYEVFRRKVDTIIQQYLDNPQFDVELLAEKLHMSRPTLYRKIRSISNFSPNDLINMARLEEALDLLSSGYRVNEVSDRVGYSSQSHFSRNFQKYYGISPREYIASKKLSAVV